MKRQKICEVCGLSHARLGVNICGRVLHRKATSTKHFIYSRNAYGFTPAFWDKHAQDFDGLEIVDTARGEIWRGGRSTLASITRETLSPAVGEQVIVECERMQREDAPQIKRATRKPKRTRRAQVEHNAIEHATIERAQRAQELRENVHRLQLSQLGFAGLGWRVRL